jgi:hypothetical protein
MRFMLQMIADASMVDGVDKDAGAFEDRIRAFNRALDQAGVRVAAVGLADPATAVTVRFENGSDPFVTDGPFADRDEQLARFWIIEVPTMARAIGWARTAPISSGAIEVRPLSAEPVDAPQ